VPAFCVACLGTVVNHHDPQGACLVALTAWKKDSCEWSELAPLYPTFAFANRSDVPASAAQQAQSLVALPKPLWMETWGSRWFQQRQQWWDAQRKRYRPSVWALIQRLAGYQIYTTLDFRPRMVDYKLCGQDTPPSFKPETDMLLCFIPDRPWKQV
jgi:hypothetical protein